MQIEFGTKCMSGTSAKRRFVENTLVPLAKNWANAIKIYCGSEPNDDAPYYYNERSNISILAGGIRKYGGIAVEEYTADKERKRPARKSKGLMRSGRADLLAKPKGYSGLLQIEAKMRWMRAENRPTTVVSRVKRRIADAKKDAAAYREANCILACVFFVPSFSGSSPKKYKSEAASEIRDLLHRYLDIKVDLWAWCFPRVSRHVYSYEGDERRYWPGVIMALKIVSLRRH